jgi:hypothetical protein
MERASRATWAKRVEKWKRSGLTAKAFAAQAGISASSLAWWRWKLGAEAKSKNRHRRRTPTVEPLSFVEVPQAAMSAMEGAIELELPSGVRVRVPAGFDPSALARLVAALEGKA